MKHALLSLQYLLAILWTPFQLASQVGRAIHLWAGRAGDVLVRPLYWDVVKARRRAAGEPEWKPIDSEIGIFPPCDHCGRNVPPDRHKEDCRFLQPSPAHLTGEQIAKIARISPITDTRIDTLQGYALALRAAGVDLGGNPIDLGNLLRAAVDDVRRFSETFGLVVAWTEAANTCREIAREIEGRST